MQLALKELRSKLGISRPELAKVMGVSVQQVGNIERGDSGMSMEALYKICEVFKVTPNDCFKLGKKSFELVVSYEPDSEKSDMRRRQTLDADDLEVEFQKLWNEIGSLKEKIKS